MTDDDHHHPIPRTAVEARVDALEALLIEKGVLDPAAIDAIVQYYEHDVGPMNGARVVARAWTDPDYKARHDRAMAASSLDAMFNYYRVNWPSEPYAARKDEPPKVKAPTLLIHGLKDPYALPAGLNDAWNWVDNEVEIYTLPRAGHFVQHEQAVRVSARLLQWLGRVGRRTSPDQMEEDRS